MYHMLESPMFPRRVLSTLKNFWSQTKKKNHRHQRRRRKLLVRYTRIQVTVVWCPSPPGEPSFGETPGWGETVVPGGGGGGWMLPGGGGVRTNLNGLDSALCLGSTDPGMRDKTTKSVNRPLSHANPQTAHTIQGPSTSSRPVCSAPLHPPPLYPIPSVPPPPPPTTIVPS